MKKITYLLLSSMLVMLFSCTEQDVLVPQLDDELSCRPKGQVIKVYPTGTDDTDNLVQAFEDAKSAGSGAIVQLVEGQYTIGMIEVREFDGYFRGAGKGKTIISNLAELPCEEALLLNINPALFTFVGGNVNISEMTFHMNDGNPCAYGPINESMYGDLTSVITMSDFSATFIPTKKFIKGVIDNVEFIAGIDGGYGTYGTIGNVGMFFYGGGDFIFPTGTESLSTVNISITNCYFENGLCGPDLFGLDENSTVKIEKNTISGGYQNIFMGAFFGTKVTIKDNTFRNSWYTDLYVADNEWWSWGYFPNIFSPKRTEFTIVGNDFESPAGVISLYMNDFLRTYNSDQHHPQLFYINSNRYNIAEGGTAILAQNNIDAMIWNNTFTGSGAEGIHLDGDAASETYAQYNKFLNNNFSKSNYTGANVYLGEFTANNMVVGVAKDKVTDMGIDNKIVGVKANKMGPRHGPVMKGNTHSFHARRSGH